MTSRLRIAALGGACALAFTDASAQTVHAPASNTVQEIIVTAQKRIENVQDVPLTVTPLTGSTLERLHMQDLRDVTGMVPNVQINVSAGDAPATAISIRGIGISNNPSPFVGTEVGTVVDGVVQGTNQFGLTTQFDIDRIEILAGPQGTLFGANTTGGVVNIVTKQPTGQWGVYGQLGYGNYNEFEVASAINIPLIEGVLAGKVSFDHLGRDGFYTNLYNGQKLSNFDSNQARFYLKWTPTADLDITLQSRFNRSHPGVNVLYPLSYPGEVFFRPNTPVHYEVYNDVPDNGRISNDSHTLTLNWAGPIGKLTSITNYSAYGSNSAQDVAGINCFCFDAFSQGHGWQASEEVRDVFHPTSNVEVLLGLYGLEWVDKSQFIAITPFATVNYFGRTLTNEKNKDVSVFGQVYWNITDRLRLQAGLRVAWDDVSLYEAPLNYYLASGVTSIAGWNNLLGAIPLPSTPGNEPNAGEKTWTNVGGKVGLDYKITDRAMVYGYYARGFKSGGFNGRVTQSIDIGPYNPEFVDSYEIGIKSEWLDRRLQLNAALFLNKWTEMQVTQSVYRGNPPVAASTILNAGRATTKGVEFQAQVVPIEGLNISANVGYLTANYDQFLSGTGAACPPLTQVQPSGCSTDFSGRDLSYSPKWNGSVAGTYTHTLGAGQASAMLQYTYTSQKWGNYTQSPSERLPAVGLLNANLSWTPDKANWSIQIWGRNLMDKIYVADALDVPPLFTEGVIGNPREFGATFKFNY